jgi:hypothetical protein
MFTDIAILPATADTWSLYSAQNEPFPAMMHPEWQTLVWESIHQNGNACDYVSEQVIQDATIQNGFLQYGDRKYQSIFLTQVESMEPATAKKLFDFVSGGGKIFCIETFPVKAPGWKDHDAKDKEVRDWVSRMKDYTDRFIFLNKPGKDYTAWFTGIQQKYKIDPYARIDAPNKFVTQVRYQSKDVEMLLFINSNMNESYEISVNPSSAFISGKQAWLWDAATGERYKIAGSGSIALDLGPSDLKLLVFDKEKKVPARQYEPVKTQGKLFYKSVGPWSLTGYHIDGTIIKNEMTELKDLKDLPGWMKFSGSIEWRFNFNYQSTSESVVSWLNLGKVFGVSELFINGKSAGVKWYGNRVYPMANLLKEGNNEIVVKIVTTMGNYMKSLTDNKIAQYWTNEGRKIQPLEPTGLVGPVTFY